MMSEVVAARTIDFAVSSRKLILLNHQASSRKDEGIAIFSSSAEGGG